MPRPRPRPRPRTGTALWLRIQPALLAAVAGLTLPLAPAGCAHRAGQSGQSALQRQAPADVRAMNAPPPPGLDPQLTKVIGPDDEKARLSLEEAVARCAAAAQPSPDEQPAAVGRQPDGDRLAEALRLYTQGRTERLNGEYQDAARDLQAASRLDPSSPDIWRELAEANLALGNRVFAASAFGKALERDPRDVRALEQTSRIALERRDYEKAAALTARLLGEPLERTDPALPYLAKSQLSRSLGALGYVSAAADAAQQAADLPERFTLSTSRTLELNALYRQRGDTLRDAGDSFLRLGRFGDAMAAFDGAAQLPTLTPAALTPRRIYAAMKLGRSDTAAAILLEQLAQSRGRGDALLLGLIGHVAGNTGPGSGSGGPRLIAGIGEVEARLSTPDRALAAGYLARARAAASPSARALAILRERLAAAPGDEDSLRDLVSRLRTAPVGELISQGQELIEASPMQERRYGGSVAAELAFRRATEGVTSTAAQQARAFMEDQSAARPAAVLLRARLLAADGRAAAAVDQLASIQGHPRCGPASVAARIGLLLQLGRFDEADKLIDSLSDADDLVRAAKAMALIQRGRDDAALETLAPLLDPGHALPSGLDRGELLSTAGLLHARSLRGEEARDLLERALEADPMRDDAYVGLIALYSPGGPLADEARLIEVIRRMRDANPSSRALRWMRAQESLGRGQLDLAERDLADLAEENPTQPEVVGALCDLWVRTGSAAQAEGWLKGKLERFPDSSVLLVKLGDALVAQGRPTEAEGLLSERYSAAPGDVMVSRALEQLYRTRLNDPAKADALAKTRLRNAPVTPDSMLELAEMATRDKRFTEAGDELRALLERFPGLMFRGDQTAKVADFIVQSCRAAAENDAFTEPFVNLINALTDAAPLLGIEPVRMRLFVAARSDWIEADKLISYVEAAVKRFPQRAEAIVLQTARDALDTAFRRLANRQANIKLPRADTDMIRDYAKRALGVIELAPRVLGKVSAASATMWIQLATEARNGESLERAVDEARAGGVMDEVYDSYLRANNRAAKPPQRADVAYSLGNWLSTLGRDQAAERMLRDAIRMDPEHPGACNDLGYKLLVADRDIEEAHRLIQVAVKKEPERASYIDSLGWARYKLGIIQDDKDPVTGEARQGAVSLLTRALELLSKDDKVELRTSSPIIIDHLGDASWAAGDQETAVRHWDIAAQESRALLDEDEKLEKADPDAPIPAGLESAISLGESLRKELKAVAENTKEKARAARAGEEPRVARRAGAPHANDSK